MPCCYTTVLQGCSALAALHCHAPLQNEGHVLLDRGFWHLGFHARQSAIPNRFASIRTKRAFGSSPRHKRRLRDFALAADNAALRDEDTPESDWVVMTVEEVSYLASSTPAPPKSHPAIPSTAGNVQKNAQNIHILSTQPSAPST